MVRSEQHRYSELPVWIGRLAEGLPRNIEEGSAVPRHGLGAAAHDEGVSHCALRGFDGEESVIVVAVVGDVRDGHEREGRAPGARPLKEEGARLPERLAAARLLRVPQATDCLPRRCPLPETDGLLLVLLCILRSAVNLH